MNIPNKKILKWLMENYGLGGFINYEQKSNIEILKALKKILEEAGLVELDFLGRFLVELSEDNKKVIQLLKELEEAGF
jgi:hypothetical protein